MINIKNIILPTDFSEFANKAIPYAVEIAKKFDAQVTLLHVVAIQVFPPEYGIEADYKPLNEKAKETANVKLEAMAKEIAKNGIQVKTKLLVGSPSMEIINVAKCQHADMIIMATHGQSAVRQLILGSTAEKVVQNAPCPVTTI